MQAPFGFAQTGLFGAALRASLRMTDLLMAQISGTGHQCGGSEVH
jgi:hypothetical protein